METLKHASQIVKKLTEKGHTAYFAGGWVRDYLMGHPSADIDIATDAAPEKIVALFEKTIPVGIAFGVVIVVIDGHQFEVSTFRKDIESHGRRPEKIELSSPEEDAKRRDFTINGLFYDPLDKQIYDYIGGEKDIKHGVIRTIGDPSERFYEDRLRMIRAVRFASRFNFAMDRETEQAIIENADTLFPHVAIERVWQELCKMTEYPGLEHALAELHRLGLLPVIFEQLKDVGLDTIKKRTESLAYFPDNCPPILKILELFPDAGLEDQLELCRYLKIGNTNANLVQFVFQGKEMIRQAETEEIPPTQWTHFYAHPHAQLCLDVVAAHIKGEAHTRFLKKHSEKMEKLHPHSRRIAEKKPLVSGKMLQNMNIQPGKKMGLLLEEAEYLAITHDLHDAEPVLDLLKKSPNWPSR